MSRNYRRKQSESDESGDEGTSGDQTSQTVREILELQKMKKRPAGMSAYELALGKEIPREIELTERDPFKLRTGGVIDLKKIKRSDVNNADVEEGIKQTFSKESHLRDEDEEMRRYVEEQMAKKKGHGQGQEHMDETSATSTTKRPQKPEDSLFELPEHLKKYQSKRNEDMLSNQMLCGIPEVDLGIEAKIRNIEETETAKLKLLKETVQKRRNLEETLTARQDLVKDLAKGYVQHNIYSIDNVTTISSDGKRRRKDGEPEERIKTDAPVPVVSDDTPRWIQDGRVVPKPDMITSTTAVVAKKPPVSRPGTNATNATTKTNDSRGSNQPSDKAIFDNFKKKYVSNKSKESGRR